MGRKILAWQDIAWIPLVINNVKHQEHGRLHYMAVIKAVTHPIFAFHSQSLRIKAGRKVEI